MFRQAVLLLLCLVPAAATARADIPAKPAQYVKDHYTKQTYKIPVRDGVHLYTIVYSPKGSSQTFPIIMTRTPYGISPYEKDAFRSTLGPNGHFLTEKYIFVYQDVRGRYMSEGVFENMRPHNPKRTGPKDIDESTDTYDTIDWLIKNVPNNNGKVGIYGISYPGFYTAAGMIDAHSALKAVSPQAPIANWFFEDWIHHGSFFLAHAFNFFSGFGQPRPEPTTVNSPRFKFPTEDGYQFFLDTGSLKNVSPKHYKNKVAFWNTLANHPNYDEFWQARNLLPHMRNVPPGVMTVGGWYDAENLYGALKTYQAVEKQNPKVFNILVMGPWSHGGWARGETKLGDIIFPGNPSAFFQKEIELPFFNHFLKGKGELQLPEAYMYDTFSKGWQRFEQWPPANLEKKAFFLHGKSKLSIEAPLDEGQAQDSFPSDPAKPVPYTQPFATGMRAAYMIEDQRFASRRPDVLVYQTGALTKELTLAGPLQAELFVSTTGTDSDWVIKLVDVFPTGQQYLVRNEVLRGRFRNSHEKPEPFVPDQPTKISLELLDVLHTFPKDHRLQVQICSSWFPLVDRNPQKFVPNIFEAEDSDFIATTNKVYRSKAYPSAIHMGLLPVKKKE